MRGMNLFIPSSVRVPSSSRFRVVRGMNLFIPSPCPNAFTVAVSGIVSDLCARAAIVKRGMNLFVTCTVQLRWLTAGLGMRTPL
eukprot:IDg3802t1